MNFFKEQLSQLILNPRKIIYKIYKVFSILVAFLLIVFMVILRPFVLIRVGQLISSRLGHFAGNTEMYLCERDHIYSARKVLDFFCLQDGNVCNEQLLKMFKRIIKIVPPYLNDLISSINLILELLSNKINFLGKHIAKPINSDRDIKNILESSRQHIYFTKDELKFGEQKLIEWGIPQKTKLILVFARDSSYLTKFQPMVDFSYHDYRDCEIKTFSHFANEFAKKGYYVLRMGVTAKEPLNVNNDKVIDYAFNGMRSDFMDIFLAHRCHFIITTGNGGDAPSIFNFRKPAGFVNFSPLFHIPTFLRKSVVLLKNHVDIKTKKTLTISEIYNRKVDSCLTENCFLEKGVELKENSPEEVLAVANEVEELINIDFNKPLSTEQAKFNSKFILDVELEGCKVHGSNLTRYSANFLTLNPSWLD